MPCVLRGTALLEEADVNVMWSQLSIYAVTQYRRLTNVRVALSGAGQAWRRAVWANRGLSLLSEGGPPRDRDGRSRV
jgi:hypothetical protein